ncbi:DeoR/GlpR family DNA-binding transcription regulator [Paenibacillus sp. J5C_2022]|uniref:DeoR/GlpR family DNA-binding transcription regulator n=1 Tax=Paenibacillus sp. J5C2022 TaxID=2977129 RepID=UPI0021CF3325|nr:DeoR/GlpR family DNA-binding transcription regulator [Paenibacillus sp. J5C2022]MCU6707873.1 DeoR/GlpR family DNA-binding transcription regulator [Paenibacillus sp. J5C2022]
MSSEWNDRQKRIVEKLRTDGEVKISELKNWLEVTDMTVRRDLEKLEQNGVLKRTFGGAILTAKEIALPERSIVHIAEKERIGETAVELIEPGESIFMDSGSTTLQIARCLPHEANLTVVTNALHIASELSEKKIPTIVIGGALMDTTNSMVGSLSIETILRMAFDKAFLGTTGANALHGFSNSNMHEAEIKRTAIQQAKKAYIVMDHTKFGNSALFSFASLQDVHAIITNEMPDEDMRLACEASETFIIT